MAEAFAVAMSYFIIFGLIAFTFKVSGFARDARKIKYARPIVMLVYSMVAVSCAMMVIAYLAEVLK